MFILFTVHYWFDFFNELTFLLNMKISAPTILSLLVSKALNFSYYTLQRYPNWSNWFCHLKRKMFYLSTVQEMKYMAPSTGFLNYKNNVGCITIKFLLFQIRIPVEKAADVFFPYIILLGLLHTYKIYQDRSKMDFIVFRESCWINSYSMYFQFAA